MFSAMCVFNKWAKQGQRWWQKLCSLCLGVSRAQIPFAEQIYMHPSSRWMWFLSALFAAAFLLLEGGLAHSRCSQLSVE